MTQVQTSVLSRREKQREATYDEIVRASRELLAEGAELSLRAVAAKMGMTAPALYRYVASYQELAGRADDLVVRRLALLLPPGLGGGLDLRHVPPLVG